MSYGSYLGLVYANIFPSRIRAIAIDGIIEPRAAAGTPATAHVPVYVRIDAPAASYRTLRKLLALCQQAGRPACSFASADTQAQYARLAKSLKNHPLRLAAPGIKATTFTYPDLVGDSEFWMHYPAGYKTLFPELTDLARLAAPGGGGSSHAALVRATCPGRRRLVGPATSFASAVKVARMLPNSRLVSSDNWGHTSLGTSVCVDNTITGYLIHPQAPAPKVTHCKGKVQPFAPRRPRSLNGVLGSVCARAVGFAA